MSIETTKHDSPRRRLAGGKRDSSLSSAVEVVARRSLPDVLINNANDFPLDYTPLSERLSRTVARVSVNFNAIVLTFL